MTLSRVAAIRQPRPELAWLALRFGCKRAGLRSIGSHVLRRTSPKVIQELVGHSALTMTLRYMRLAPSALTEGIDLLNLGQPVGHSFERGPH
jgi:integrase